MLGSLHLVVDYKLHLVFNRVHELNGQALPGNRQYAGHELGLAEAAIRLADGRIRTLST